MKFCEVLDCKHQLPPPCITFKTTTEYVKVYNNGDRTRVGALELRLAMLLLVVILSHLALRLLEYTPHSSWCVDQPLILSTTWREIQSVSVAGCRSNWRIKRRWLPLLSAYAGPVKSTGYHVHPTLVSQYQEVLLCWICCSPFATSCAYLRCLSVVCINFEVYSVKRSLKLNRTLYDLPAVRYAVLSAVLVVGASNRT